MPRITKGMLEKLQEFDAPTISNAIERFDIRPRTAGFMGPEIKCILPCSKPMIGYACTAKISAAHPPTTKQNKMKMAYYAEVKKTPWPTFAVIQDIDPSPLGSFWGEVQASTHRVLGCIGTVTNGGVRDLDALVNLNFGCFANCVLVSHAYVHIEDYDCQIQVGGLIVGPRDLLYADKHGVVLIPTELVFELAEACRKTLDAEEPVIQGCRKRLEMGVEVNLEKLGKWWEEMSRRRESR